MLLLLLFQMHFFFIRNKISFAARNNFVIGEQFIIFTYTYIGLLQETRKCTAIIFILRIILFLSIWQTTLINIIAVSKSESEQWKKAARCEDKFQTISKATKKNGGKVNEITVNKYYKILCIIITFFFLTQNSPFYAGNISYFML